MTVNTRPVREADLAALARMDLQYDASRVLALTRQATSAEPRFSFAWREREPQTAVYNSYSEDGLSRGMSRADLFVVAEAGCVPVGLLMVLLPGWTDAGEICDLAVDRAHRRSGGGRALVEAAMRFGLERGLRALWAEPRSDNAAAIGFYLRLGFRISGFNDRMYSNGDHGDGRLTLFMHREL